MLIHIEGPDLKPRLASEKYRSRSARQDRGRLRGRLAESVSHNTTQRETATVEHGRYLTVVAFALAPSSISSHGELLLNGSCDRCQVRPAPWSGARHSRSAQMRHRDEVL
jgi:hypothetical protein